MTPFSIVIASWLYSAIICNLCSLSYKKVTLMHLSDKSLFTETSITLLFNRTAHNMCSNTFSNVCIQHCYMNYTIQILYIQLMCINFMYALNSIIAIETNSHIAQSCQLCMVHVQCNIKSHSNF